jgi:hypothetical protein
LGGTKYFVRKKGVSWIFVDDVNDAQLLKSFAGAEKFIENLKVIIFDDNRVAEEIKK